MKKLRFAPLIRVSTEGQADKGESLRTQKKQIEQYVQILNGIIPKRCWQYSGQEHATSEYERKRLDQLLKDSTKNLFDAVIVCDASRWSRDNRRSKDGLETLRANGKLFYVGTTEYDLFNPEQCFFLGLAAEIGEFQANQQNLKSIVNRIERAKRGLPSAGQLPYGRTFDKKTGKWGIDKKKQEIIQYAAKRYLAGDSMPDIAAAVKLSGSNLFRLLRHRCGDEWVCSFKSSKLNINETVIVKMPPLLDQDIIDRIVKKAEANKTYTRGQIKNKYLLNRMIFCDTCGKALTGQTNSSHIRYYRHFGKKRAGGCKERFWVRADHIEEAIIVQLFSMFGNKAAMESAIKNAMPDRKRLDDLSDEFSKLKKRKADIKKQKDNVVDMIAQGVITADEVQSKMEALRKDESSITERIGAIEIQLQDQPTDEIIKHSITRIKRAFHSRYTAPHALDKMTYKEKRELVETAFAGKDKQGKRLGVYAIRKQKGDPITYSIHGILSDRDIAGQLPMDEDTKEYKLKLETIDIR